MSINIGATWPKIESITSAGNTAVQVYNAGGASSGQALIDAAIGVMAAASALAENIPVGALAAGAGVLNSLIQLNQAIDSGDPQKIMLAIADTVGSAAGLGAAILPPPYNSAAAAISIAVIAAKPIIQSSYDYQGKVFVPPFPLVDPDSAIQVGLIHPKTLLPIRNPTIPDLKTKVATASTTRSPITLDLNADGIATTALTDGAYFDHDGNGFAEQTGWVNGEDGLLVRDLDGNGTIDNGGELFGSETLLASGQKAANGFEALRQLDSNGDGQINQQDSAYASLKIWKDIDGDGYSNADELFSLNEAGVQSIATGYSSANNTTSELRYMGHTLSDNRHGLIASAMVTTVDGYAEREAAKVMIHDAVQLKGDPEIEITLGADKGYDAKEFIDALIELKVTPHVAQNTAGRKSAVPDEIAATVGYGISLQKRKLIEQGFGWAKTVGNIRQVMVRGIERVDQMFVLTMAAYNLTRMRTLGQIRLQGA